MEPSNSTSENLWKLAGGQKIFIFKREGSLWGEDEENFIFRVVALLEGMNYLGGGWYPLHNILSQISCQVLLLLPTVILCSTKSMFKQAFMFR